MKNTWKSLALAAVLAWWLPWVLQAAWEAWEPGTETVEETMPQTQEKEQHPMPTEPEQIQVIDVWMNDAVVTMELSDYLTGVLISEMPGSFHMEAKKAQAVVARTYALRRMDGGGKHPGAVCTDSRCCQGYTDPSTFGNGETVASARQAVEQTNGLVLVYDGQLIDATYFSTSGGMTEDAVAVWGSDVPYLQSVESPGEEIAAHYEDTVFFTKSQLEKALGICLSNGKWIGAITYTEGGGVATMVIEGRRFQGTQLRSALCLRSTAFTVVQENDGLTITTRGYGHRVGMSQYGAQAMALDGIGYADILTHYYRGAMLVEWIEE